ncbi:hypothetical protein JZ751_012328, partial [Albula glossodonta]
MGIYNEQGEAVAEPDTYVLLPKEKLRLSGTMGEHGHLHTRSSSTHSAGTRKVSPKDKPLDTVYV